LGSYLSEQYGEDYYSIAFVSNSGTYTAKNSGRLNSNNIMLEGKPGSFEFSFHRTGIPYFFFDFNQVNMNEPASSWLTKKLDFRSIGAVVLENQEFHPTRISEEYNAIIYIDSTHASNCWAIN
jgi:erythromycin esterase-like protein